MEDTQGSAEMASDDEIVEGVKLLAETEGIFAETAGGVTIACLKKLVASGAISLADGVRLVRERGIRMQASGAGREGRMAALIGLDDARLPELVTKASAHGIFGVANRNSPGQVVVSGERPAVEFACGLAKELGAKRAIENNARLKRDKARALAFTGTNALSRALFPRRFIARIARFIFGRHNQLSILTTYI